MGWGRWLLLGDLGQQMDLADQRTEIEALRRQLAATADHSSAGRQLESLRREHDELKLYLAAVLRLLVGKNIVTAAEIRELVSAVDREDGAGDARYEGPLAPEV